MLDITREPIEVAPTAHYSMGGVWVRPEDHSTDVRGLYAIGEASSGLHGANRLGGNSLIELLVHGRITGRATACAGRPGRAGAGNGRPRVKPPSRKRRCTTVAGPHTVSSRTGPGSGTWRSSLYCWSSSP